MVSSQKSIRQIDILYIFQSGNYYFMKPVAALLRETLQQSLPLLRQITESTAGAAPAPGKWSYKEIIGHLIDSAANNHQKFIRTMDADGLQFPPYEQNYWVSSQQYNERSWEALLSLWEQYNLHLAHVMEHMPAEVLQHSLYIGDKGPYTLKFIVPDYLEHLKHHLKAILPAADFLENNFKMVY